MDSGRPARREKANQRTEQRPSSYTRAPWPGRKSQRTTSPKKRDEERHSSVAGKCPASDKHSSQGIPPLQEREKGGSIDGAGDGRGDGGDSSRDGDGGDGDRSEDEYTEAMEEEVVVRKRTLVKRVREAGDSGEDLALPEKR